MISRPWRMITRKRKVGNGSMEEEENNLGNYTNGKKMKEMERKYRKCRGEK